MIDTKIVLAGRHVRLEPLDFHHVDGLLLAACADPLLYRWSAVPQSKEAVDGYVRNALSLRDHGSAVPFAIVRSSNGEVIGSTRFWNIEQWSWPENYADRFDSGCDACEIRYPYLPILTTFARGFPMLTTWRSLVDVTVMVHTNPRREDCGVNGSPRVISLG